MARLVSIGILLAVGASLGACTGHSQKYATASSSAGAAAPTTAYSSPPGSKPASYKSVPNGANNPAISFDAAGNDRSATDQAANSYCATQGKIAAFSGRSGTRLSYDCIPANAYAPPTTYYGNGHTNPSISYDATLYDRQTLDAEAGAYCATQGKSAAFSGRNGSRVSYDCVPASDAAYAPVPVAGPAVPSVTYLLTGDNRQAIDTDVAAYCASQGRIPQFRGQDGTRVTYDCMLGPSTLYRTATYTYAVPAPQPVVVPTITYELAGDSRQNLDQPAIRYCGLLGKAPVLRSQDGRRVTYDCL
jgi:putative hemolysin